MPNVSSATRAPTAEDLDFGVERVHPLKRTLDPGERHDRKVFLVLLSSYILGSVCIILRAVGLLFLLPFLHFCL